MTDAEDRKNVFFRCDPKIYADFAEILRKKSANATTNVGAALVDYMRSVIYGSSTDIKTGVDPDVSQMYDSEHVVRAVQRTLEAVGSLGEAMKELQSAAIRGSNDGNAESESINEIMRNAAEEGRRLTESSARLATELHEREAASRRIKRPINRKVSGG